MPVAPRVSFLWYLQKISRDLLTETDTSPLTRQLPHTVVNRGGVMYSTDTAVLLHIASCRQHVMSAETSTTRALHVDVCTKILVSFTISLVLRSKRKIATLYNPLCRVRHTATNFRLHDSSPFPIHQIGLSPITWTAQPFSKMRK